MKDEISYNVKTDPDKFNELCESNRKIHMECIDQHYTQLIAKGVPEQYIYVIQRNSDDKRGDLFSFSNKDRLHEELYSIQKTAKIVCGPDVYIFYV